MHSKNARLDRFISGKIGVSLREVKLLLAQKRVLVDGDLASDVQQRIGQFNHVSFNGEILQSEIPRHIMLNKPSGVVSATVDPEHKTVIDLLDMPEREKLHIVGRLDFNSTGLLMLTNDGHWSRAVSSPEQKIAKWYRVTLEKQVTEAMIEAFSSGIRFEFENIITRPATIRLIHSHVAEVCLTEGRYHQIRRMFGRFQNRVLKLHRFAVGNLQLDPDLGPGESREITRDELAVLM